MMNENASLYQNIVLVLSHPIMMQRHLMNEE